MWIVDFREIKIKIHTALRKGGGGWVRCWWGLVGEGGGWLIDRLQLLVMWGGFFCVCVCGD